MPRPFIAVASLVWVGLNANWLIDDIPGKIGLPKEGNLINLALSECCFYIYEE